MKHLADLMSELAKLSQSSEADKKHFAAIHELMGGTDFAAIVKLIDVKLKSGLIKSPYQKELEKLKEHFVIKDDEDAEIRMQRLLTAIKSGSDREEKVRHVLSTGGAVIANGVYQSPYHHSFLKNGMTPLLEAIKEVDTSSTDAQSYKNTIQVLLRAGSTLQHVKDIDAPLNVDGDTILHIACRLRLPVLVSMALQQGANPNVKNKNGVTPLHLACFDVDAAIAIQLLDKGADPAAFYIQKENKIKPFSIAAALGNVGILKIMIAKGYKVKRSDLQFAEKSPGKISHDFLKAPFREKKKRIIERAKSNKFFDREEKLAPFYGVLFSEEPGLSEDLKRRIDKIYRHDNPILKPLLDFALLSSQGKHLVNLGEHKNLKMIVSKENNLREIRAGGAKLEGLASNDTVFASGFEGNKRDALAALLHELKHFTDQFVYGDMDKPYLDKERNRFNKVKNALKKHSEDFLFERSHDAGDDDKKIYASIYSIFTDYKAKDQDAEVMVKVPEIIGYLGVNKGVAWLKKNEPELLSFYVKHFNPACESYMKRLQYESLDANKLNL